MVMADGGMEQNNGYGLGRAGNRYGDEFRRKSVESGDEHTPMGIRAEKRPSHTVG